MATTSHESLYLGDMVTSPNKLVSYQKHLGPREIAAPNSFTISIKKVESWSHGDMVAWPNMVEGYFQPIGFRGFPSIRYET